MSDELKPALSAKEWAEEDQRSGEDEFEPRDNGDVQFDRDGTVTTGLPLALYERHLSSRDGALLLHALAAVCLRGQPFGFTHEMLRGLDALIEHLPVGTDGMLNYYAVRWRIAALLPPADG